MVTRVGQLPGLEMNTPDTNHNTPMFLNFVQQTNLVIVNTLPVSRGLFTHFMKGSGKGGLLDYGLIDNEHTNAVKSFIIDENARFACGTDHALLVMCLDFQPIPKVTWRLNEVVKYNFNDNTKFKGFQDSFDAKSASIPRKWRHACPPERDSK